MFYDSASDLFRVLVVGTLAYVWLVLVLRLTGKRTLAQLNAFDFVVTVALGSTLATVLLSKDVSLAEGALALALLVGLQVAGTFLTSRVPRAHRVVTAAPRLLVLDGVVVPGALDAERLTAASLQQVLRSHGLGSVDLAAAVVMETDGSLSVVPRASAGDGSAWSGLDRAG